MPGDVDAACGHLAGENTYPFDVMKVAYTDAGGERRIRYSVNLAEIGFGAAVMRRTARMPAWLGRTRSFLAFWSTYAPNQGARRAHRGGPERRTKARPST